MVFSLFGFIHYVHCILSTPKQFTWTNIMGTRSVSPRFAFSLFAGLVTVAFSCNNPATEPAAKQSLDVIAYYVGDGSDLDQYPVSDLTHIIYSFLHLDGNKLAFDNDKSEAAFARLVALKATHPDLKVLLSLGGWSACKSCSDVFSTPQARLEFAESVRDLVINHGADGLDLDWEYPAIEGFPGHPFKSEDKPNFTELVRVLRQTVGDSTELSFAAGGFSKYIEESIDWANVMPLVNRVNVMTYDLVGGYSTTTGHHTPLYGSHHQQQASDPAILSLLEMGVPSEKIVIGSAFYGRVWENVDSTNNGLYRSGAFKQGVNFKGLDKYLSDNPGYEEYWDDSTKALHMYNAEKGIFLTLDDRRSVQLKTEYALDSGLGGIMFWHLTADTPSGGLLQTITETIASSAQD